MTTDAGKVVRPTQAPSPDAGRTPAEPVAPQGPDGSPPLVDTVDSSNGRGKPEVVDRQNESDASKRENAPDAAAAVSFEAADAVPQALKVVGSIVAPTTLLTALFLYFGLLYAVAYYRYFGVNYTVLDLPNQGYLILSASTATLPLALLAGTALAALWLYQLPLENLSARVRRLLYRWWLPAVATVGVVLLGLVAADVLLAVRLFPAGFWEARGLSLSIGIVLLAYAAHLRSALAPPVPAGYAGRRGHLSLTVAKWVCLSLLFGVGLFWAVGSYAMRMGVQGAEGYAAGLRCAPNVVLYSDNVLNLQFAGVQEESVQGPDGVYQFRYSGLKLVPQAGKQYLLLPADWAPSARPAILLPRSDTLRLEFITVASTDAVAC
jgi:hypothetical protein